MQLGSGPGTIVVWQRWSGLFWAVPMALIFVVAIVAGVTGQGNIGGKIFAGFFFGSFLLLVLGGWLYGNRRRARIEIDSGSISFCVSRRGAPSYALSRGPDSALRLIPAQRGQGVKADARLTLTGPDADGAPEIILYGFSVRAVMRGCEAAGWRFR